MDIQALTSFISAFGIKAGKDNDGEKILGSFLMNRASSRTGSIKFRSRDLIAQYPVLASDNISAKTLQILNKGLEVEYVNLLRLLIQNDGATNFSNTGEYLSRFHQNISNRVGSTDEDRKDSNNYEKMVKEDVQIESKIHSISNRELLENFNENLNFQSLNELTISRAHQQVVVNEAKKDEKPKKFDDEPKVKSNITSSEVKKANELSPTNITVTIDYKIDGGSKSKDIIFGVKCVTHLIESADVEYYLPNAVVNKTPVMRFIQWTSGEIKFFSDLLFSIDEIKKTAIKSNSKGNFWWRKLQTLSKISKHRSSLLGLAKGKNIKRPIPTSTMIISKENVDNIKYKHGIDILEKPSFAAKIIDNFFLMNFIIVDESIETVYMYNDETKDFSILSFRSFENFSKQKNIDIKDIYSLLK
ncbi:hypothetical protein Bp8pS_270 [Bacillus phage vB_BpuM-BpSp]|nr:hypothetical protein Bp8pS_270 [Bacillus phage vB_BpuM-BpSp]